jgi:hypothetical protein
MTVKNIAFNVVTWFPARAFVQVQKFGRVSKKKQLFITNIRIMILFSHLSHIGGV